MNNYDVLICVDMGCYGLIRVVSETPVTHAARWVCRHVSVQAGSVGMPQSFGALQGDPRMAQTFGCADSMDKPLIH